MKNWVIYIWFSIGIIVLVLSVFDYQDGIILRNQGTNTETTLSILITFLVAWQIWQTMASREEIKEAREVTNKISALEKRIDNIVPTTDAHFQFSLAMAMRVKGLELGDMLSENTNKEDRRILAQKTLYTSMAFSQFLSALKMYSDIETIAKEYIEICFNNVLSMAMRMRGNYRLITSDLINIMISDLNSAISHTGKVLSKSQISELEDLRKELESEELEIKNNESSQN